MDSQGKFCRPGNISGASRQNRAASVDLNRWRGRVSKRGAGKDDRHGFTQLVHSPATSGECCNTLLLWTMKLPLTFHQHMLSRSWLNFVFWGWTVPSVWLLKRLERERELAVSHQTRLTWTPEPSAAITTRAQKLLERFNLTYFHCSNKQSGWCQMQKMQLNNWSVDEADIHDEISTIWEDTWTAAATAALDSVTTVTMTLWWKLTQTGGR